MRKPRRGKSNSRRALLVPRFDHVVGELRLNGQMIWQRVRPAKNQELILRTFEEQGWPERIDDPLYGPVADRRERLHKTIQGLNASLLTPAIAFQRDGSGKGLLWRITPIGAGEWPG